MGDVCENEKEHKMSKTYSKVTNSNKTQFCSHLYLHVDHQVHYF